MPEKTDWNKDIPWLGAWIPLVFGIVLFGSLLAWIGVPVVLLVVVGPFVIAGVFLFLWGPNGRFTSGTDDEAPGQPGR